MSRANHYWVPIFMSDPDIPDRIIPAIRWVIVVIVLFVLALGISDTLRMREYNVAAIYCALFVVIFLIAVKWHFIANKVSQFARFLGRDKVTVFYIGLGVFCALGLGFSIGKIMGRTDGQTTILAPSVSDTGRIAWNIEEAARGLTYFLGFNRQNQEEIRISGFNLHGKNTSNDPITKFKGYIRSDITNEQLPIYLMAEDPNKPNDPFAHSIPTLAEHTYGIPGLAEFNITTFDKTIFEGGKDGIPLSKFLRDFGEFTMVLEYDGTTVRRHFSKQEIQGQIDLFERQTNPGKNTAPRVVRRPDAPPVVEPAFPFQIPPSMEKPKG